MTARSSPASQQALAAARGLMQQGRNAEAAALLRRLTDQEPRNADALLLLGGALQPLGDLAGSEAALRAATTADRKDPRALAALGDLLARTERPEEAEKALAKSLSLDRRQPFVVGMLARLLNDQRRFGEAIKTTTALCADHARADVPVLWEHARALSGLARLDEALEVRRAIAQRQPNDALAAHNVGSALADLKRHEAAAAELRRALALGSQHPETWWLLAGAYLNLGRFADCEDALRQVIARSPLHMEAWRELGHVVWMRTADLPGTAALYDPAIARYPRAAGFRVLKAKIHEYAGDPEGGYRVLTEAGAPRDSADIEVTAAQAAMRFDRAKALAHARRAMHLQPESHVVRSALVDLLVANGHADEALSQADALLAEDPADQHALALKATALRQLSDPDYSRLYDFETMVRGWTIDTPQGWPSLSAYLADLKAALLRMHTLKAHPIGQSLRKGTQTHEDLTVSSDPAIRAFFEAIDGPIRRHMKALGEGRDPLRRRNTFNYRISGIWSVRLQPNGFHEDHLHPQGWLSSAFYVDLPPAVDAGGREGWIKFGEPGVKSDPPLGPEYFVKPEPGMLVLFPSYMWHGTVPFGGDQPRLTIAFDVVPA
ncbi:tetratricopeptide repeat protein [Brevundimonas sp.]|uniref:tetratricopeptide repeat protein n=1 Tax=Brevundimonas sp. TaxID=1871086 RepID=UPI0025DFCF8B|nr:tetratricopeptide repeat protein [Brevundimonas sp.]